MEIVENVPINYKIEFDLKVVFAMPFFRAFFLSLFFIPGTANVDFRRHWGDSSDAHFSPKVGSETTLENRSDLKLFLLPFRHRKRTIPYGIVIENVFFAKFEKSSKMCPKKASKSNQKSSKMRFGMIMNSIGFPEVFFAQKSSNKLRNPSEMATRKVPFELKTKTI